MASLRLKNVEKMCTTPRITKCIFDAKICAKLFHNVFMCVKNYLSTHFFNTSHIILHSPTTPNPNQSFPLFHTVYNNNYLIK